MAPRHKYTIAAGSKLAIYTYHGCHLEVNGKARVAYVGKDTPMIIYSNIHNKLQEMRAAAAAGTSKGPRVSDFLVIFPLECNWQLRDRPLIPT